MISSATHEMIPKIRQYLVGQPIKKARFFGSFSRGEERPDSDIDILVQYDNSDKISLLTISRITAQMRHLLGRDVDPVEDGRLNPFAEESANREKSYSTRERIRDKGRLEHILRNDYPQRVESPA